MRVSFCTHLPLRETIHATSFGQFCLRLFFCLENSSNRQILFPSFSDSGQNVYWETLSVTWPT